MKINMIKGGFVRNTIFCPTEEYQTSVHSLQRREFNTIKPLNINLNTGFIWESHQFLRYIDVKCHNLNFFQ